MEENMQPSDSFLKQLGAATLAGAGMAALGFGGRRVGKAIGNKITKGITQNMPQPSVAKSRVSLDREAVSNLRAERPQGIMMADLNRPSREVNMKTGELVPNVQESLAIRTEGSPSLFDKKVQRDLAALPPAPATRKLPPTTGAVEGYVAQRRQQADPVDRLSAELELDRQALRVREVKEELGGQVLDQLQQEGRQQGSFSQDYLKKQGYVDGSPEKLDVAAGSNPVRVQSTDAMDVDGFQEYREIKRKLQRDEDLDIGAITAKVEPNFGAANPEQVDNAVESVASKIRSSPIRERTGTGDAQTSNVFAQMQENVDDDAQNFARQYMERREMKTAQQAQKPPSRRIEVESPQEVAMREGAMKSVEPRDLADSPIPERTLSNFGPDAQITSAASNTSIRGTSRIDDRTRAVEPTRELGAAPDVGNLTRPIPSTGSDIPGYKRETYQGGRAQEGMDPYAVKQRETDLGGGMGIYGQEQQFAAGPQSRQTGEYTATAGRVPSQVFAKDLDLKTPSGKPFANPVTVEGASPKQTRVAPEYDRMSDQTLENVAAQSKGPSAQKLGSELERRKTARASMQASDRIREINRSNPPEKAQQMVRDFLSGFGS